MTDVLDGWLGMDFSNPGWFLQTLIGAVIGAALGVVLSLPISWRSARRSSTELKETAKELRATTEAAAEQFAALQRLFMRAQEAQASRPVYNRDADGNIIGVYQYFEIRDVAESRDTITTFGESAGNDRGAKPDTGA